MADLSTKKFFRCTVCNDIHFGMKPPEVCPTCRMRNAYVKIDRAEAKKVELFE